MLDISLLNIVLTLINYIILFFLAKKFLFDRVDAVLKKRQEEVDDATVAADKAIEEARAVKKEYEEKISMADEQKEQIFADIKKQGYEEYDRIVSDARKKSDMIIVEAKHNAEAEAKRAKEIYAAQLTDVVIGAASKIAATKHSEAEDRELYDKFINEAGAENE